MKFTYLARKCPDFFKQEHILNAEFERKANTGDVILFKSQHSAARFQRVILNSDYGTPRNMQIMLVSF